MSGKIALVIGATSGVGEATALELASQNVSVTLVGRDVERGKAILKKCGELGTGVHAFESVDISLVANVKAFAAKYKASTPHLDYLILTAGILTDGTRRETKEENDIVLAVSYYARFVIFKELEDLIKSSKTRTISVLAPGKGTVSFSHTHPFRSSPFHFLSEHPFS